MSYTARRRPRGAAGGAGRRGGRGYPQARGIRVAGRARLAQPESHDLSSRRPRAVSRGTARHRHPRAGSPGGPDRGRDPGPHGRRSLAAHLPRRLCHFHRRTRPPGAALGGGAEGRARCHPEPRNGRRADGPGTAADGVDPCHVAGLAPGGAGPGLIVHRSARIMAARHPCQAPPRTRVEETVLDLVQAARSFDDALGWASAACGARLTTPGRITAAMTQRAKLRFRVPLQLALGDITSGAHTVLEYRYLHDVERPHGLPRAERQVRVLRGRRSEYRDALYQEYLVAVETDGRMAHPAETRWADVRRDNAAAADGVVTLRYGWSNVTARPCLVAAEVGAVLARRGWPGPVRPCGPGCALRRQSRRGDARLQDHG